MTATVAGWALLGFAIVALLVSAALDRRLQRHRASGAPAAAYLGPIGRWRRDLYTAQGAHLIWPARLSFATFCAAALAGALVLESA